MHSERKTSPQGTMTGVTGVTPKVGTTPQAMTSANKETVGGFSKDAAV